MSENQTAIQLMELAKEIGARVTQITQMAGTLPEGGARTEVLKASYELTKQVEVIKKQMLKLQKEDNSEVL